MSAQLEANIKRLQQNGQPYAYFIMLELCSMVKTLLCENDIGKKVSRNHRDFETDELVAYILEQLSGDKIPHKHHYASRNGLLCDGTEAGAFLEHAFFNTEKCLNVMKKLKQISHCMRGNMLGYSLAQKNRNYITTSNHILQIK